jgi:hypothetical protein
MTVSRTLALALGVAVLAASGVALAAPPSPPTTKSGLSTATSSPGSAKMPAAATQRLSAPGQAAPPSGVTPGAGKGSAPAAASTKGKK